MLAYSWVEYPAQTGIILLLVAANAFFVATEFAFVKIRSSQLKAMRVKGKKDWRLSLAIQVTSHLDRYLSATQLGITLTGLALGFLGEPVVAKWLVKPLAHLDAATGFLAAIHLSRDTVVISLSYAIAFAGIAFVEIVLGELVPKYFAIRRPRPVVLWVAAPLMAFYYLAYPFIWLLNRTANRLLLWMGIPPTKEFDHGFNQEELQYVLMNSRHVHPSDELVNKIMLKAIRLKETTAEQVMLPREQVVVLWRDKPLEENLAIAQKIGLQPPAALRRFARAGARRHSRQGTALELPGARRADESLRHRAPDPHVHGADAAARDARAFPPFAQSPRPRSRCRGKLARAWSASRTCLRNWSAIFATSSTSRRGRSTSGAPMRC